MNLLDSYFGTEINIKDRIEDVKSNVESLIKRRESMGIFSLSKSYNDELLWAYYANSHKGFCIGYDFNKLINNNDRDSRFHFEVNYSDKPPELEISDFSKNNSVLFKMGAMKSKRWEHEQEVRIITNKVGVQPYDYKALKQIFFGLRMSDDDKKKIMDKLKGRNIDFYQMQLIENTYNFQAVKIQEKTPESIEYMKEFLDDENKKFSFEIIEKKEDAVLKKATIKLELNDPISEKTLRLFAEYIKNNLFINTTRFYMFTYLKSLKNRDLAWGISHFVEGNWSIKITEDEYLDFK